MFGNDRAFGRDLSGGCRLPVTCAAHLLLKRGVADPSMDACTCFSPAVEGCIARQDAAFRLGKSQFNPENASRAATMPERELAENVDFRFAQGTSASRSMSAAAATFLLSMPQAGASIDRCCRVVGLWLCRTARRIERTIDRTPPLTGSHCTRTPPEELPC